MADLATSLGVSAREIIIKVLCYNLSHADIDECTVGLDNCDDNANCANTIGGFTCACNMGFIGDGISCRIGIHTIMHE